MKAGKSCDAGALWTIANGKIEGRVVNAQMKPEPGFLTVFPAGGTDRDYLLGFNVGKHGKFEFGPLPSGRYRLSFHTSAHREHPFYFPEGNEAIELGEGQRVTNIIFVLQ